MAKRSEGDIYVAIVIAILIGIIITFVVNIIVSIEIEEGETFSELYFLGHQNLPSEMILNKTYTVSFLISNYEKNITYYHYRIISSVEDITETVAIYPGGSRRITISVTPEDPLWHTNFTVKGTDITKLETLGQDFLALKKDYGIEIGEKWIIYTGEHEYLPITHNIPELGAVYHTNITIEELKKKPFEKSYRYDYEESNKIEHSMENITLFMLFDEIYLARSYEKEMLTNQREPFIVKVAKKTIEEEEPLEVHFWYSVERNQTMFAEKALNTTGVRFVEE